MKLQLALDTIDIDEAIAIVRQIKNHIDIIEIGTPIIIRDGIAAVRRVKESFPDMEVFADLKIMDGGRLEAEMAFEAGADSVSVLAVAYDATVQAVIQSAKEWGRSVLADMIGVKEQTRRAMELDRMGVDYICVHTASDIQNQGFHPLVSLRQLSGVIPRNKLAAAGGIRADTVDEIVRAGAHIIVVGQGILAAPDREKAAFEIKSKLVHEGRA
jgi:3-hexulose-6-phosphate synthase